MPSDSVTTTVTVSGDSPDVVVQVITSPPIGDVNDPVSCCKPSAPNTFVVICFANAV